MSDPSTASFEPVLSRRDWFRLRRQSGDRASQEHRASQELLGEEQTPGLEPALRPPNHDGMELSELPPMHEATLNESQVRSLFSDIEACATDVRLQSRRNRGSQQQQLADTLGQARDHFLAGDLPRLQIRYSWQSAQWIDTLEQSPGGFRLVRIRHA